MGVFLWGRVRPPGQGAQVAQANHHRSAMRNPS